MTSENTPARRAGDVVATTDDQGLHHAGADSRYSPVQRDQLRALQGCGDASDADLDMLFAVAERTGLDPWLREIYLIGRRTKVGGYRGEPERWETRWTVQAGIDGLRAVTHRHAAHLGHVARIGRPTFYDHDGGTRPIWLAAWGTPAAVEVTVSVGDGEATGIATWDEYCQTKKDGQPTQMWREKGPTMLAKCAEAQAHRKICPLSAGVYVADEMPRQRAEATRMDTAEQSKELTERLKADAPAPAAEGPAEAVDVAESLAAQAAAAETYDELKAIHAAAHAAHDAGDLATDAYESLTAGLRATWNNLKPADAEGEVA